MRFGAAASILIALVLATACASSPSTSSLETGVSMSVAERAEFETLMAAQDAAWNAHDIVAMRRGFWDDAIGINYIGRFAPDMNAFSAGMAVIHGSFYRNSHVTNRVELVKRLAPDVVLVVSRIELTGDERRPGFVFRGRGVTVFTRRGAEWRAASFQNTQLAEGVQ